MSDRKDGGPAFPCPAVGSRIIEASGMSLRDWFAGMAMQGWIACQHPEFVDWTVPEDVREVAQRAYQAADAMLAERSRTEGD